MKGRYTIHAQFVVLLLQADLEYEKVIEIT